MGKVIVGATVSLDGFIGDELEAGLVDELHLGVVPVLFGAGKRFFREATEQMLENPRIIEGDRVLHLAYSVRRG